MLKSSLPAEDPSLKIPNAQAESVSPSEQPKVSKWEECTSSQSSEIGEPNLLLM